jgi:hypothetical protein
VPSRRSGRVTWRSPQLTAAVQTWPICAWQCVPAGWADLQRSSLTVSVHFGHLVQSLRGRDGDTVTGVFLSTLTCAIATVIMGRGRHRGLP